MIIVDHYQVIDTTVGERRRMMLVRDKRESERISIKLGVKVPLHCYHKTKYKILFNYQRITIQEGNLMEETKMTDLDNPLLSELNLGLNSLVTNQSISIIINFIHFRSSFHAYSCRVCLFVSLRLFVCLFYPILFHSKHTIIDI